MRKVRITKEQLETIVESTLNTDQTEVVNEELLNEEPSFLDPILWNAIIDAAQNFDVATIMDLFSKFQQLQALLGGLGGLGIITGILAFIRRGFKKWDKEETEKAAAIVDKLKKNPLMRK
tara:strand:- start:10091 stop:10450 length:360 start_codon:yes stop_codon:yes gene_type:complete